MLYGLSKRTRLEGLEIYRSYASSVFRAATTAVINKAQNMSMEFKERMDRLIVGAKF
jgi:hypothetical protein